jgi:hypothetical protein
MIFNLASIQTDLQGIADPVYNMFANIGFLFLLIGSLTFLKDKKKPMDLLKYLILIVAIIGFISVWDSVLFGMKRGINSQATLASYKMKLIFDHLTEGFPSPAGSGGAWYDVVGKAQNLLPAMANQLFILVAKIGHLIKQFYGMIQEGLITAMWIVSPVTLVFLAIPPMQSNGVRYILASISLTMWAVGFLMVDFIIAKMLYGALQEIPNVPTPPSADAMDAILWYYENQAQALAVGTGTLLTVLGIMLFAIFLYLMAPVLIFTILSGGSPGGVISKAATMAASSGIALGGMAAMGAGKGPTDIPVGGGGGLGNLLGGGSGGGGGGKQSPFEQMMSSMSGGNESSGDKSSAPSGGTFGSATQGDSGGGNKSTHAGNSFSVLDVANEAVDAAQEISNENNQGQ